MRTKNPELKAGLVVLAAVAVLLGMLYYATGGAFFKEWRTIHLRIDTGALAPERGDLILMQGVQVGRVESVCLQEEVRTPEELGLTAEERADLAAAQGMAPDDPALRFREIYVLAVARVEADQDIPVGTYGEISESITGSRDLQLIPSRSPVNLTEEDTRREPIQVHQQATLNTITRRLEGLADQLGSVLDGIELVVGDARGLIAAAKQQIEILDVEGISDHALEAAASLRRSMALIEARLEGITQDVSVAAAGLKAVGLRAEEDVPAILADVREVAAKLDAMIAKAAPKVDSFLDSMDETGRNLVAVSSDLAGIGPEAEALIAGLGHDADELMQGLIDTAHNLLDASGDLRAHPWKLLNEPGPEEIAHENLRNAMQNYVRAMSRMNSTSETLREILGRGETTDPETRALLARTLAEFQSSVDRYRNTERRLMELLQLPR